MSKKRAKRGPKPETVKIEGDWEDAIDKALEKKRPEGGWPKEESSHSVKSSHSDDDSGQVEDDS